MTKRSYSNRLRSEKSPYLLQHAHNPVDWFPWGEEAFQLAQEQDKPIFLSIGYATCHWCHVMEEESFNNIDIAKQMNEAFINIKVDREEQPEIDSIYMEFAQAMTGEGGWPLNVILTPDRIPFFAGTYMPPISRMGMVGLTQLIPRILQIWKSPERVGLTNKSIEIIELFKDQEDYFIEGLPTLEHIDNVTKLIYSIADSIHGGINAEPKFPMAYHLSFMLRQASLRDESRALFYVELTLNMMHAGGLYDHLGGGFSRYSVDTMWLIPHFEKMLYDNALLARIYLETWQVTKLQCYKTICTETLDYLVNEMMHKEGGFFSAQDADTEGGEGLYYTWTKDEIINILGKEDGRIICQYFGVTQAGNFEGRNVLHLPFNHKQHIQSSQLSNEINLDKIKKAKAKLLAHRLKRPLPFKDDKILAAWNGLVIGIFAKASYAFCNPFYLEIAEKTVRFIKKNMWRDNTLLRRWRDGEARFPSCLDEYAFLIHGLITLYEVTGKIEWLEWTVELTAVTSDTFRKEDGPFYLSGLAGTDLILRRCDLKDGDKPSGNAVHCENLIRLYQLTGEASYLNQAELIFTLLQ